MVQGGVNPLNSESCFLSETKFLDLACNKWYQVSSLKMLNRTGGAAFIRNSSLWVIGGSNGFLFKDFTEIPLSLANELPSKSARDKCRAKNYCSPYDQCSQCKLKPQCIWCNSGCALNNASVPVLGVESSQSNIMGELPNGLCPINSPSSSETCPNSNCYHLKIV